MKDMTRGLYRESFLGGAMMVLSNFIYFHPKFISSLASYDVVVAQMSSVLE
jgi:hypothetical protein